MKERMLSALKEYRMVTAIKDIKGLERCLGCESPVVFVLFGSINNIPDIVNRLKERDKIVIVHVDLINGLSNDPAAIEFIKGFTRADGIITTRPHMIKVANQHGLIAIQRFFLLDSRAIQSCKKYLASGTADLIEILPGCMPKVIREIIGYAKVPLIAGGLILDGEDCAMALEAGAVAVSTTNAGIWSTAL